MTHAAKNTAFKNQLRNFLRDENHFYRIILVHLTSNVVLKKENTYWRPDIEFLKNRQNSKFHLTHSLTDHSRKRRAQTKQRMGTILCHNSKLTGGMCLLGFRRVCTLCALSFLLSSIKLLVFFVIQRNHTKALIFHINTFFKQHNRHHKLFKALKLHYCTAPDCTEVPVLHDR